MSTRKHSPRNRAYQPAADRLEDRQLLSALVSGTDAQGDVWTLRLIGPGDLTVVKQNGPDGNPAPLNSATNISQIIIGGTDPTQSRVVGTLVSKGVGSDGRVTFNQLTELPGRSNKLGTGQGLVSIDMPNFWLVGNTTTTTSSTGTTTSTYTPGAIDLPDGVDTFRFGGVDTTVNLPTPTSSTTSDVTKIEMGLPTYGGTRIIIDKSITGTQQAPSSTAGGTPTTVQHAVLFDVSGRLQLFQANEIVGDAAHPPGQFGRTSSTANGIGGTTVFSSQATQTIYNQTLDANTKGTASGQIGFVKVGGNATNFTTIVVDNSGSGSDRLSNYFVGGETNNVMVIAPGGARDFLFGKGMDTVDIQAHVINSIKANRGAVNSKVVSGRTISNVDLGGDVVNTNIISGYNINFSNVFTTITGASTSIFGGGTPAPAPDPSGAQAFGGMTVHVAGDVVNSVFAASVQPFKTDFSSANALTLPGGHIRGKIEGSINNSTATPAMPNKAFYAQKVDALSGPVIPPNAPEAPYAPKPVFYPGIHHPYYKTTPKTVTSTGVTSAVSTPHSLTVGKQTPRGPAAKKA